ncbi:fused PTS fructose transporter subunit IIA/HPr protein [Pasteurellaceae bacterium HPA106]|uniref:fused PTS fructose transporter subunit IIA/HPr protein n=1 Tax=Spirabiliibacterium pneumoniae TaxID=221400 RepID=UPI001AACDF92|nr:fused PTS fructose transporter subunit IIA/HPr protein [Spirabiliibacterium pneumoniae]MBE2896018.1 fused PTS fructose transporter subunit IIA/HPr protein [Spirabiliibacterium pneumoniae]
MFELPQENIRLAQQVENKAHAIATLANALISTGYVKAGYEQGMLVREQQTSTFLGNGIAIPHGTLDTRDLVLKTGVQILQIPQGVDWGDGNIAYVVIAIAARSDEHLSLLRQLTHVLSDEQTAEQLAHTNDVDTFRALLMGESQSAVDNESLITLDVDSTSLLALNALNSANLEQAGCVDRTFIRETLNQTPLHLGDGVWLADSPQGNRANGIALARTKTAFEHHGQRAQVLVSAACVNADLQGVFTRLLQTEVRSQLLQAESKSAVLAILHGQAQASTQNESAVATRLPEGAVEGTFMVKNENGLHARPSALLVQVAKKFTSQIQVDNLSRQTAAVSAKSMMKVVSLGATKGHQLHFVAQGDDANAAIDAIGQAIAEGLGE